MARSSRTGYYQMIGAVPSDAEDQQTHTPLVETYNDNDTTRQDVSFARHEPDSRVRRTLRSVRQRWSQRKEIRDSLPTFRPWFTVIVALVNIGMFVAVAITDGLADITFTPKTKMGIVDDFDGQEVPAVREEPANFFIGPAGTDLIHHGAKYAPVSVTTVC